MTSQHDDTLDDSAIEALVRDLVGGWEMPPTRLDHGWRSRVRTRGERRLDGVLGWLGRAGRAASAGVVLTVVAALLAVALTGPRTPVGTSGPSGSPERSGEHTATPGAAGTPLPKLVVEGDVRIDPRVLVRTEVGYAIADLSIGELGRSFETSGWASAMRAEPDGTFTCLCVEIDRSSGTDDGTVTLVRFGADGVVRSRAQVASYHGAPDPRPMGAEAPRHVDLSVAFDPDGSHAYVGWTVREHPRWRSGVDVVDLASATVVQTVELPSTSDGEGDVRVVAFAPAIVGRDRTGGVMESRAWYSWTPAGGSTPTYSSGSDGFVLASVGGRLGPPTPLIGAAGCGDAIEHAGPRVGGGMWIDCVRPAEGAHRLRLVDAAGSGVTDVAVPIGAAPSGTSALSPDGRSMLYWDPLGLVLTRVDTTTGEVRKAQAPRPTAAADDPLRAFGRWLAPTAAAKILLEAGLVLSPDGSTAYALGIGAAGMSEPFAGSTGIFVFATAETSFTGRWSAPADLVSLAVSADGRYLLAAGAPGVDADGRETGQRASIVVFDVADGRMALVAGQLGRETLLFPGVPIPVR